MCSEGNGDENTKGGNSEVQGDYMEEEEDTDQNHNVNYGKKYLYLGREDEKVKAGQHHARKR